MKKATSKKSRGEQFIRGVRVSGGTGPVTYTDTRRPCFTCDELIPVSYFRMAPHCDAEPAYGTCPNGHTIADQFTSLMEMDKFEQQQYLR